MPYAFLIHQNLVDPPAINKAPQCSKSIGYLRFTANDSGTQSIVEAGIDAVQIFSTMLTREGDMDNDNDVDLFDYALFSDWWLKSACGLCGGADRSGDDGAVGLGDLLLLRQNWLKGKK